MARPIDSSEAVDLNAFLGPAAFWVPSVLVESAWTEHGPFALWLTSALRPRRFVELGTHRGYSFFVICQAVVALKLDCECNAIDHWLGDEHAGFYGEDIFDNLRTTTSERFPAVARLIRSSFAEAAPEFEDASVDLLHIDGRHRYEDVKEDFESWRPKLSDSSVVLFHDTQVTDRDFGVKRFWAELSAEYPSFEFLHGHGLGVLGFGARQSPAMVRFFEATRGGASRDSARSCYGQLGQAIQVHSYREELDSASRRVSQLDAEINAMKATFSWRLTAPLRAIARRARSLRRTKPHTTDDTRR